MFNNFGFGEVAVIALLGLVIFGPEKLPKAAGDAVRMIRQLRSMATSTVNEFKADLSPEMADLDLKAMHPRRLIEKALLEEESGRTDSAKAPAPSKAAD